MKQELKLKVVEAIQDDVNKGSAQKHSEFLAGLYLQVKNETRTKA